MFVFRPNSVKFCMFFTQYNQFWGNIYIFSNLFFIKTSKLLSEPEFYGDLVYRIRKIMGKSIFFSEQFRKLINLYKRIGYNPYVMRQTAYLVINPTSVDSYALLFNWRRRVGPQTQWRPRHKAFTSGLGLDAMSLAWFTVVQLVVSFNSSLQWGISQEQSFFVS